MSSAWNLHYTEWFPFTFLRLFVLFFCFISSGTISITHQIIKSVILAENEQDNTRYKCMICSLPQTLFRSVDFCEVSWDRVMAEVRLPSETKVIANNVKNSDSFVRWAPDCVCFSCLLSKVRNGRSCFICITEERTLWLIHSEWLMHPTQMILLMNLVT